VSGPAAAADAIELSSGGEEVCYMARPCRQVRRWDDGARVRAARGGGAGRGRARAGRRKARVGLLRRVRCSRCERLALCIQNPPNAGTQTLCQALGTAIDAVLGFDIPPGVNAPASNTAASGQGIAVVRPAGQAADMLAPVDLTTGTLGMMMPLGTSDVLGIAVQKPASVSIVGLLAPGTGLVRFTSAAPGTTSTVGLSGVAAGETMVGIDFRPQTGQLFGFAVDASANTGTLYRIDPQTGVATAIGTTGQIAFTIDGATPIDFPDPTPTVGWGVDFNPAIDFVRVDNGTGLNFRVNPNTGAPVDGNLGQAMAVPGTNPDPSINGATTGVSEVATRTPWAATCPWPAPPRSTRSARPRTRSTSRIRRTAARRRIPS
jgi:hypothetical protein